MKAIVLTLFALLPLLSARAEETQYQQKLQKLRDSHTRLEIERHDYRKPEPKLTPAQEQEWLRLSGQLLRDDPIQTLQAQLYLDLDALKELPAPTAADKEIIEDYKEMLAHLGGCADRAKTLAEATALAKTLRQFIARRDVRGLSQWIKQKFPE